MQKKLVWLVVLLAVIVVAWKLTNRVSLPDLEPMASSTATPTPTASRVSAVSKITTPAGQTSLSYTDAVKKYNGYRIQFDDACRMTPSNITFKNNTVIMLDNRSKNVRTVALDSTRYTLGAYSWKTVTISAGQLPHNILVDCNGGQNVGQILLQK